ncbi:MAG: SRPBCC family protein [Rhodospirillales bacterium]|nr:SRPBCC family protein [Rhodospirillales bacterium]
MNDPMTPDAYGVLREPATLVLQRLLPGPIERVWAFLTESDLRRQWLASGVMDLQPGAGFELTWRNDALTEPSGKRPDGFAAEHRMACRILALDPPRALSFTFGPHGEVDFTLEPAGGRVLLTLTHRRVPDRATLLKVSAGWHAHLDLLTARASGTAPLHPHWDHWTRLAQEYDRRLPA